MYIIRDQINEISIFISLIRYLESELSSFSKNDNSCESNYADILNSNMLKMASSGRRATLVIHLSNAVCEYYIAQVLSNTFISMI